MKKIIIAIDGPAGSGKSTSARLVAEQLNYTYLDTGAMYRAITLAMMEASLAPEAPNLSDWLATVQIRVEQGRSGQRTYLNGHDVSRRIRQADVTAAVSAVSARAEVRECLVRMQQELGKHGGIVVDGRDIGTVVFPQAELKIFLIASIQARANRRLSEATLQGRSVDEIAAELERRDAIDSSREHSPLVQAKDAIVIDTSHLSISEQVSQIVELAHKIINNGSELK